LAADSAAI